MADEEPPKKQNRPGTFVSGDPRSHDILKARKGIKKEPDPALYIAAPEGMVGDLAVMFHVINNRKGYDKTAEQMEMRAFKDKKPEQFYLMRARLEGEHRVQAVGASIGGVHAPVGQPLPRDIGAERAMELIKKLQDDFEEKERQRVQAGTN